MRVTAEISLYPLTEDYLPAIEACIRALQDQPDVEVVVNQMSTQLRGELGAVMGTLERALRLCFDAAGTRVVVAKILNVDLAIGESPAIPD